MAIWRRKPSRGLIFHSDRGSQYCSHDFQKLLKNHGVSTLSKVVSRLLGSFSCLWCGYFRIDTEGQSFLFSGVPVSHPPVFRTVWADFQI